MKNLVSVIIPIYNVEEFLTKCIESIRQQTYENIEIILINDESPDNCDEICDYYALIDSRIKVVHQKNGGLSDARNTGIKLSKGEYILFVDSDDYIDQKTIEILINKAEENGLDIVSANGFRRGKNMEVEMTKIPIPENKIFSGIEYMYYRITKGNFQASAWINLYKSELIKDNSLYFKKGLIHEDEHWTPQVLLKAQKVMYINFHFYNYNIRENSITHTKNKEKNIESILYLCEDLVKIYESQTIEKKYIKEFKDYLARQYMATAFLKEYNKKKYKNMINKKFILSNSKKLSTFLKAIIYLTNIELYVKFKNYTSTVK